MHLVVLRSIFAMVSVGIAVIMFNSEPMKAADEWVPWAVLGVMVVLPVTVIGLDASIKSKNLSVITAVYFGMIVGLFLTYVTMLALAPILPSMSRYPLLTWLQPIVGMVLCYICTSLLLQTMDDFRFLIPYVEFARDVKGMRPVVLDSSVIVDGRVAELAEAGIFESRFVVPSFVVDDLQEAADSTDRQRRARGRRGLDVLEKLRGSESIDLEIVAPVHESAPAASHESRVVELAKQLSGRIVTTDVNLVKVAKVRSVAVINLNDVAVAIKSSFVSGDSVLVRLVRAGEEQGQGVGYLDDGTMVVVEGGREHVGHNISVNVTKTLQTSAGRLVFARPE